MRMNNLAAIGNTTATIQPCIKKNCMYIKNNNILNYEKINLLTFKNAKTPHQTARHGNHYVTHANLKYQ